MKRSFYLFGLLMLMLSTDLIAQYTIKGRVKDQETAEPVPFANVFFKGTQIGINTDFDGYFTIKTSKLYDSLMASYIGYVSQIKVVDQTQKEQTINFQIKPENTKLNEVEFVARENPSWAIMRKVMKNKKINDKRRLQQYEYESYTKVEFDIDNVSKGLAKRRAIKKVLSAIDSIGKMTGEDGKPLIPIFLSETISKYYYRRNPKKTKEHVLKSKITGVGIEDGTVVSQLIGASFQEYNFYKNWMKIAQKDFVSPLADGWKLHYRYFLMDSVQLGKHYCYKIDIVPKNPRDLTFEGSIWIDKGSYALKQIDVKVNKRANINFLEKIKIQQTLEPTESKAWLPSKTRVLIDIAELTNNTAGLIAKFYVSNKNLDTKTIHPQKFYFDQILVAEDFKMHDDNFWVQNRHDSLTAGEKKTYSMINSIKNLPVVKTWVEIISVIGTGYKGIGPVDVGNYLFAYALNNYEGHRFRIGFRTNGKFSRKIGFNGYLAYGAWDQEFKYGAGLNYIISRKPWTTFSISRTQDIQQAAIPTDDDRLPNLYLASIRFFNIKSTNLYLQRDNKLTLSSELFKGLNFKVRLRNHTFEELPGIDTHFAYRTEPERNDSPVRTEFTNTELMAEVRWARRERFIQTSTRRISLGTKYPVFTFRYRLGIPEFLNSDFSYHKFTFDIAQNFRFGTFGNGAYQLSAGYIPSQLPYPLLFRHLGNQTIFFNNYGFNLMNYLEFTSDQYASFRYEHTFEGLIFNRIPLFRRLKWRSFAEVNMLVGSLRPENASIIPTTAPDGTLLERVGSLGDVPYVEVAYGVENILKFLRVHFIHRITYLDAPGSRNFGVKVSAKFSL